MFDADCGAVDHLCRVFAMRKIDFLLDNLGNIHGTKMANDAHAMLRCTQFIWLPVAKVMFCDPIRDFMRGHA
jgi:hypothetical protein